VQGLSPPPVCVPGWIGYGCAGVYRVSRGRRGSCPSRWASRAKHGRECPVPPGISPLHPEGMGENSPGFQPCDCGSRDLRPEGTADPCCLSRPFGTDPRRRVHPGLKPWAILICPFGTGAEARLLTSCSTQILLALEDNVRAPFAKVAGFGTMRDGSGHGCGSALSLKRVSPVASSGWF